MSTPQLLGHHCLFCVLREIFCAQSRVCALTVSRSLDTRSSDPLRNHANDVDRVADVDRVGRHRNQQDLGTPGR